MNNIFLVFGYGIPKDILKDENYNFYLKTVFNKIYDASVKNKSAKSLIICCGGETDVIKPYKRNEADEMIKFFAALIKKRSFLDPVIKNWIFVSEKKSLSTLENLINSKKIIGRRKTGKADFFIFCEQTREKRIKVLAKKVLGKNCNFQIIPVDFDISSNRYLPSGFLEKKERLELKHSLWALRSPENLEKYHKVFAEKMEYLRKAGPKAHVRAVKKWWEQKLEELKS